MIGDLLGIMDYLSLGYEKHQDVPKNVGKAYSLYTQHDYTKCLLQHNLSS